jgi:hypothetical protein
VVGGLLAGAESERADVAQETKSPVAQQKIVRTSQRGRRMATPFPTDKERHNIITHFATRASREVCRILFWPVAGGGDRGRMRLVMEKSA